ncbi:ferrochelatase [Testudinibacter sp. TR-2022]|uniref:ferrochelatase n=1 Tax=Testudinibacter sp. TR-2022 TaxID=2585029 RepID=UPI0011196520|nr:ferrochelatase [Testudinibacter sp. TR-2022]TNH02149.1 ferrochelatase [Pasteurellaceae bacterium Phil31]TNH05846.1 ferrochelatase [Testudinibacter sp. TR-2022]TNH07963.1 ferrochelatase [Testudinibacter sp. TR-2022]TNH13555.1 ferrochelatase [Testudinibacter sp. TR-2022]TNH14079.1 ferrochelatase [Testudinibacter sp. TR-2022]
MMKNKIGVLLVNLGTPSAPTTAAVKHYLKQFLSDPRVIDLPRLQWSVILNAFILPRRAPRVAKLYQAIWTEQGSPLLAIGREQVQKLQHYFTARQPNLIIELAMTYGEPSMQSAVDRLIAQQVQKIIVLPLYPQYSSTTTASVFDAFAHALKSHRAMPEIAFIHHYHQHPLYIQALANSIRPKLQSDELLIFSFHGIPERYQQEGDCYAEHCHQTALLVANTLELTPSQWQVTFQSRFGKEPWLQPYTDETLQQLAQNGQKALAIVCPGFAVDCLETIEEIEEENREIFLDNGGERYQYIPALNASDEHIELLATLIEAQLPSDHTA